MENYAGQIRQTNDKGCQRFENQNQNTSLIPGGKNQRKREKKSNQLLKVVLQNKFFDKRIKIVFSFAAKPEKFDVPERISVTP